MLGGRATSVACNFVEIASKSVLSCVTGRSIRMERRRRRGRRRRRRERGEGREKQEEGDEREGEEERAEEEYCPYGVFTPFRIFLSGGSVRIRERFPVFICRR